MVSPRLLDQVSPLDDAGSGSVTQYLAKQVTRPGATKEGYYGFIATMDVYGFNLSSNQLSTGAILLYDQGDARRPASTCSTLAGRLRQGGTAIRLPIWELGGRRTGTRKLAAPIPVAQEISYRSRAHP
ncbi:uncharacterized protein [Triticum aestivum]|uniref:uncharacterized protein n=1 Tax=Triticum aestivum TaxID=4565 RepID=UPI001D01AFE0|nr:uncharacterized protein LOC123172859 [Triticum aestivum]